MRCPNCLGEMVTDTVPRVLFRIGRFEVWCWDEKQHTCVECESDRQQEYERRIFDAGQEAGADALWKDLKLGRE